MTEGAERRAFRRSGLAFTAAALLAVGFTVVYWWTDDITLEGIFLGSCLILLAVGLVQWSRHLPEGPFEETYPTLRSPASKEAEVLATIDRGGVGRRRFLLGALGLAGGSVLAGAVSAVRSLGPGPYSFAGTPWRGGRTLVTLDGTPVRDSDVPLDTFLVVAPEGFTDAPMAEAVLMRIPPDRNRPRPGRELWDPGGLICYSRVCTHAGCAVGQYDARTYQLQCPCHQSVFDVLKGAQPAFGPAARPLPQLPLTVDSDGTLRSTGDFSDFVGPTYWHRE
jgi:ubiquinol-cytochrome c reductase iron-sulfur subunit